MVASGGTAEQPAGR